MVLEMALKVRMMLVEIDMSVGRGSVGLVRLVKLVGLVGLVALRMFWVGLLLFDLYVG